MDDILVFTQTLNEHRHVICQVLQILRSNDLYLKPEKCEFEKDHIEFLGFIVTHDHISMDPVKVSGVTEWPAPSTIKDVQSFLGFTNFYRRFIHRYADIAAPLNALTKKSARTSSFVLSDDAADAFNALKRAFVSSPVLRHFDPERPSTLVTDASDFAIAGILHQPDDKGFLHPVSYFSRKLSHQLL